MQQHNQYHLHIHTHIHMQFHAHMFYAILYMHYAHRSSFYLCSSSCIVHCLQKHIQAKGNGHRPDGSLDAPYVCSDRLQSKAPAKSTTSPFANRPGPRHIGQTPTRQYPMPSPRKIDATVIHTREIASLGIDSSRRTPQKWEDMVMRMQSLEAKFGGDLRVRDI